MKILIYDRDSALTGFIKRGLEIEGHECQTTNDQGHASEALASSSFDLFIVEGDRRLDKLTRSVGLSSTRQLALISRNLLEDRIACLDAGADDCLAKPFSFAELSARVRAVTCKAEKRPDYLICYGDLELNRIERTVRRKGVFVDLTPKQFALLEFLMLRAGSIVSRSLILEEVWRTHYKTVTNVVDEYINQLRNKLEFGASDRLIRSIRGIGYQLVQSIATEVEA